MFFYDSCSVHSDDKKRVVFERLLCIICIPTTSWKVVARVTPAYKKEDVSLPKNSWSIFLVLPTLAKKIERMMLMPQLTSFLVVHILPTDQIGTGNLDVGIIISATPYFNNNNNNT